MNLRKLGGVGVLITAFMGLILIYPFGPYVRLLYATLGILFFFKVSYLIIEKRNFESPLGFFLYLFAWPGIESQGFEKQEHSIEKGASSRFFEHWATFIGGVFLLLGMTFLGRGEVTSYNYGSLLAVLLIVHLGLVEVFRSLYQLLRFRPNPMFDRPFLCTSLRDFWSHRWNLAFVEMDKFFVYRPLRERVPKRFLLFFIFAFSGILHEMGISYTSGSNLGGPLLYFLIQGIGFLLEKKVKLGRVLTLLIILLPLPLLFPPSFVNLYLGGFSKLILVFAKNIQEYGTVSLLLKVGGVLQALILLASFQVPGKLKWKEELKRVGPFNRKVFWTYGIYIFSIIIFLAVNSFLLSFDTVRGLSYFLWLIFILIFWVARVLIDFFYFSHKDWPPGEEFVVGHICLTTLFLTIVLVHAVVLFLSLRPY